MKDISHFLDNADKQYSNKFFMPHQTKLRTYLNYTQNNKQIISSIYAQILSSVQIQMLAADKIEIEVEDVNKKVHKIVVSRESTGYQIKEAIHAVVDSLPIDYMKICYEGVKIFNNTKISSLQIVVGSKFKFTQEKQDQSSVQGLYVTGSMDLITDELETVKMPCGHAMGKICMTQFLRSLITAKLFEIRCPHKTEDNLPCLYEFQWRQCQKIGVLTKQEINEFEMGLSKNWLAVYSKKCPKCKFSIIKGELTSNRVVCPNCGYGDFCFYCLQKWKNKGMKTCGSQTCASLKMFLEGLVWNVKFKLRTQTGEKQDLLLPKFRLCPKCHLVIEHIQGCKHMKCPCGTTFCWVCLGMLEGKKWACGAFNDKCPLVAQTQKVE